MKQYLIILLCCCSCFLQGTSLVYNLKIRRSFTGLSHLLHLGKKTTYVTSALPVIYYRKARFIIERTQDDISDKRIGGGAIVNLRMPSKHWWFETTTAIQKESVKVRGTQCFDTARSGLDDIVLSAGYNAYPSKNGQFTLYGLAGFPTTRTLSPADAHVPLVGTRFFALGAGAEYSYSYINTPKTLFAGILQGRVIHFFSREAEALLGPSGRLQPGQTIDLLFSMRYRHKRTVVESGYNPTFFVNVAAITQGQTFPAKPLVRHGGYLGVVHLTQRKLGHALLAVGGALIYNAAPHLEAQSITALVNFTVVF